MLTAPEQMGTVVVCAGAILLLWAGLPKLSNHYGGSRRVIGVIETWLGLFILLGPGRAAAGLIAGAFLIFSLVHGRDLIASRRDGFTDVSCDCFEAPEPVSPAHAGLLTLALGVAAVGAGAVGAPSLLGLAEDDPAALAWLPSVALALALSWRLAFSGLGPLTRLVDRAASQLTGAPAPSALGIERRSFLLRVAVVGSALAVAPVRFLLYPGTALAAVIRPDDCRTGLCTEGYTGFCCEIQAGGANTCPTGTFPGGWWMCTDYRGHQLCSAQGVRYYVDCNALPGEPFPGGCRCGNGSCDNRKIACSIFRYGQCNTQIEGTTAVVCRMVTCENPAQISELNCSAALAVDDSVCGHEAPCLEPRALELAGAGGA